MSSSRKCLARSPPDCLWEGRSCTASASSASLLEAEGPVGHHKRQGLEAQTEGVCVRNGSTGLKAVKVNCTLRPPTKYRYRKPGQPAGLLSQSLSLDNVITYKGRSHTQREDPLDTDTLEMCKKRWSYGTAQLVKAGLLQERSTSSGCIARTPWAAPLRGTFAMGPSLQRTLSGGLAPGTPARSCAPRSPSSTCTAAQWRCSGLGGTPSRR